jgi:hypothetical protein
VAALSTLPRPADTRAQLWGGSNNVAYAPGQLPRATLQRQLQIGLRHDQAQATQEALTQRRTCSVVAKSVGTVADVDHLLVAPAGAFVINAKNYEGRVERRDRGGWFSAANGLRRAVVTRPH